MSNPSCERGFSSLSAEGREREGNKPELGRVSIPFTYWARINGIEGLALDIVRMDAAKRENLAILHK